MTDIKTIEKHLFSVNFVKNIFAFQKKYSDAANTK
jgi:hypothetical protein